MNGWTKRLLLAGILVAAAPVLADNVSGARELLCTPTLAHRCFSDDECVSALPSELNLQNFVLIDLDGKEIRSTPTSPRQRKTPLEVVQRDGEIIAFQGYEMGRAFSGIISEPTGQITLTIALDDGAVVVFGACMPAT